VRDHALAAAGSMSDLSLMLLQNSTTEHWKDVVQDYAFMKWGVKGRTATDISGEEHVAVLCAASRRGDSAVSKTCNVSPDMYWADFKDLYIQAWRGGAKGCTTFNPDGKRFGILKENTPTVEIEACYVDPETGARSCG
jgi:ribonucleoside-diphosphate reductase alpha chain